MSKYQIERQDPLKPSVVKKGAFWWARAWTLDHQFSNSLHHTHAEALARASELAAMNKEAAK